MNSFYAEQKGLFTFYIEQEDEMERLSKRKAEQLNPELEQPLVKNKRRHGRRKLQANATKIEEESAETHQVKRSVNIASTIAPSSTKDHQPSLELSRHPEFSVEHEKPHQIFHRRKDLQRSKHLPSSDYRVVEQRPGIIPEMIPNNGDNQTPCRNLSAKKLREFDKERGIFNRKCFLPMIGSSRLHPSLPKQHSPEAKNQLLNNQQQQAIDFIFESLNIEQSRLNPSRNLSEAELKRKPEQVVSHIQLPRKEDPYRELARWQHLRREVAKRYNFPL